jgi:hypothetical protein
MINKSFLVIIIVLVMTTGCNKSNPVASIPEEEIVELKPETMTLQSLEKPKLPEENETSIPNDDCTLIIKFEL